MNTKKYDIICAGEMLIDFTPNSVAFNYTANPGGAPANVAISTARNGLSTAFLGKLGKDDFGKRLASVLEENNIDLLCPELTEDAITTLAFVTLYEDGDRSFTFARKPGADLLLSKEDVENNVENIKNCNLFHAGSLSLSNDPCRTSIKEAMKLAKESGKLISFDVNYRDSVWENEKECLKEVTDILPSVDLLKISDEELFFVGGEENIPTFMKQYDITVVIETLGPNGAKYYFNDTAKTIPGLGTKCVDATGAGDAFWGGFLSRLLMFGILSPAEITADMLDTALQYGNKSGGICVTKPGGIPAIPTAEEINAF